MKKLIKIAAVLVILLVVAIFAVGLFLGSIIKKGVETFGPKVAKVETKIDSANLSLLSGSGSIKGIFVGNPEGYKSPSAIKAGEVSISIKPGTVLSDKVVIQSVRVISPEITMHGLKGDNLQQIINNIQASAGGSSGGGSTTNKPGQPAPAAGKKLQVDEILIKDAKVNLVLGLIGTQTFTLPEIHFTNLGQGPEGITPTDLAQKVLQSVLQGSISGASSLPKAATGIIEGAGKEAVKSVEKVSKGIGDLFKK